MKIYSDRSMLVHEDGSVEVFAEGKQAPSALQRYKHIKENLSSGWFENLVVEVSRDPALLSPLSENDTEFINNLVNAFNSEYGRAVVGLFVVQLVVKSLAQDQSIRLHKGGSSQFSWIEGISMRSIDSQFITPVLRKYNLLSVNADGVFMTRTLAENYPYTRFYKASIRGVRDTWLELVDRVESRQLEPFSALKYVLACLFNRTQEFSKSVETTLKALEQLLATPSLSPSQLPPIIKQHISGSTYSARLLEIAVHSFLQVLDERGYLEGKLVPLCQMRTANKKHRNIADVEIVSPTNEKVVLESMSKSEVVSDEN